MTWMLPREKSIQTLLWLNLTLLATVNIVCLWNQQCRGLFYFLRPWAASFVIKNILEITGKSTYNKWGNSKVTWCSALCFLIIDTDIIFELVKAYFLVYLALCSAYWLQPYQDKVQEIIREYFYHNILINLIHHRSLTGCPIWRWSSTVETGHRFINHMAWNSQCSPSARYLLIF